MAARISGITPCFVRSFSRFCSSAVARRSTTPCDVAQLPQAASPQPDLPWPSSIGVARTTPSSWPRGDRTRQASPAFTSSVASTVKRPRSRCDP